AREIPVTWSADREQLPPLHRIREIAGFLAELGACRAAPGSASQLLERCPPGGPPAGNPWWLLLRELLEQWRDETGDAPVAATETIEFLYAELAERRREPARGEGVHLGTVHSAKGLEFAHVLLVDGGWAGHAFGQQEKEEEEERRLFYVGMTRARETLTLLQRRDERNPHVELLAAGNADLERLAPELETPPEAVLARRFALFGLNDLFLDYAGRKPPDDPVHESLGRLQPGCLLTARSRERAVELLAEPALPVAMLSQSGRETRASALSRAEELSVVALVERRKSDSQPEYQPLLRCERWYVPLIELRYRQVLAGGPSGR
ncbi:MAG: ATP-binding domain-containing protein, partial [Acidobacteriota bacterium]|nr:ATP-binding domain-containing protein [Acidobacteriota bacterium]